jgi:hypothetical protein
MCHIFLTYKKYKMLLICVFMCVDSVHTYIVCVTPRIVQDAVMGLTAMRDDSESDF